MQFLDLEACEKRVHSENGEDGVLQALFARLGTTNRYFVEFGAGDGTECNAAYLLEQGWQGLLMDGAGVSRNPLARVRAELVMAENINALLRKYQVPPRFDLLSIDIDGNDFWVWREIGYRPRVVVIEYNASVPPNESRTIVYDPQFRCSRTDYFGASLLALAKLGQRKGYTLVYCERAGVNAFFVADELLPPDYRPLPIEAIYRPPNYQYQGRCWPPDPKRQMMDPFLAMNEACFRLDVGLIRL